MTSVNPRTVDVVVFDFGGVLIHALMPAIQEVADEHGVTLADMVHVLMGDPTVDTDHPWHRAERGELAVEDIQAELQAHAEAYGIRLAGDEINRLMNPPEILVDSAVHDRIHELREAGYRTALLTNSFREFRPILETLLDLDSLFDVVVDSSAVGARKPSPQVFAILLERLDGVPPERIVFLDDFAGNVAGATAAGIRAIHVTDVDQALAELDALLADR